jgi:hypothetical protein
MIELSGSFDASNQAGYIARLNDINLDWAAGPPDRMATFTDATKTFDPSDCSGVSDPPC